jgi:putative membrane-bound dehydrogenase-like protein
MRFSQLVGLFLFAPATLSAAPPSVADPNLVLELVACEPDIVTPTGVAVDAKGRIWCIENNTHQRGSEYKGPPSDRIRVFEDFDESGRARNVWTFAEGFKDSMGLTFGPDGSLYLATRAKLFHLTANDDKETSRTAIVTLETKGNYPHNGLCGFTWDGNGDLIFGLGENLGESYKLVGSDGTTLTGGGEGGSMYRCRPDGSKLHRIATGFWNPFAHCFDANGNLFMVDNDPDARGPCRLCHVIEGGDYGYRFRYGRKGTHPFQAWNGELPGTLPMVAGTSEAPSGIIAGDFTGLGPAYAGKLLVTSWGDHTIEAFTLAPRGASFAATSKVIVRGDENFRPVAIAAAPEGSVVFSDWVDKSYPVHGKGRIWRLRPKSFSGKPKAPLPLANHTEAEWAELARTSGSLHRRLRAMLHVHSPEFAREFLPDLGSDDPFILSAALTALGRPGNSGVLIDRSPKQRSPRLGLLLALRKTGDSEARELLPEFLVADDPAVRRAAIQWVGEERLTQFAGRLEAAATKPPVTRELFEAWLAARELLDGKYDRTLSRDFAGEAYVASILKDPKYSSQLRTLALRALRPDSPLLTPQLLAKLYDEGDAELRGAVVRTAMLRADAGTQTLLRKIALDETQPVDLRALAVVGLGQSFDVKETREVLERLIQRLEFRADAERSLGRHVPGPRRTVAEWREFLATAKADAKAGERVFYQSRGAACYKCHTIDNRGGPVGPDLSFIARSSSREKLIDSILEPSKEIAPMYTAYRVLTRDGKERVGLILGETFDSFVLLGDAQGKVERIPRTEIEERTALPKSIMPDDLPNLMTPREFADLLAFLLERK